MKNTYDIRPKIVVSKCLGFDKCRYNGQGCDDSFIKKLNKYVEFIPICPEVEIGLSTPRDPIRIVQFDNGHKLIQPSTNYDYSQSMISFSKEFINNLDDIDGFILKSKSPSCGIKDVKVYHKNGEGTLCANENGFFAKEVINIFSHLAVENEGRLKNFQLRDDFLTTIFTLRGFKESSKEKSAQNLINFHEKNKLLFMSYNTNQLNKLNKLVTNIEDIDKCYSDYEYNLCKTMASNRYYKNDGFMLLDSLDYFNKYLTNNEKNMFINLIKKYHNKKVPLSVPINILKSYAIRCQDEYILKQTIFSPYPEELLEITDSGKGKDY
jgi:uncharacterized protein YbbK (DUF523 family)/uncharacterized protein YbgA (DUF1722 family)